VDNGLYQFEIDQVARTNSILQNSPKPVQNKGNSSSNLSTAIPSSNFISTSSECKTPSLDTLHARLGHTSVFKMQHIPLCKQSWCKQSVIGSFPCDICVYAKMHRFSFNKSIITTSSPFQLIHLDILGPYKVAKVCGACYFLTIVDDFTRTTWTQLLQNKTRVSSTIIHFPHMVQTQFHANITMVRSDNSTEFLKSTCFGFFSVKGVVYQKSIVGTPQQNGVAERKHRHLLGTVRAVRFQPG